MGAVVKISAAALPKALERRNEATFRAIAQGALRAAHRGRAQLVKESPVDQGQFKGSWKVRPGNAGTSGRRSAAVAERSRAVKLADTINDAPHAGIIEVGARPHPVSAEGIQAITEWVLRQLRDQLGTASGPVQRGTGGRRAFNKASRQQQAEGIALAIARKIRLHGQEPQYIVRGNLALLHGMLEAEVARRIDAVSRRKNP